MAKVSLKFPFVVVGYGFAKADGNGGTADIRDNVVVVEDPCVGVVEDEEEVNKLLSLAAVDVGMTVAISVGKIVV